MKLKQVQNKDKNKTEILTSVKITKEEKIFIFEHGIVLRKLVKQALEDLKKEIENGKRKNNN